MDTRPSQSGFTLIELMVVVGIIGMLSALAIVSFGSQRVRSREARRIADVTEVVTGVDSYYAVNGAYPLAPGDDCSDKNTGCTIDHTLGSLVTTGILKQLPKDPYPAFTGTSFDGRCYNYTYKTPGTADGGSFPTNLEYRVGFGAELAGDAENRHPLNKNISTGSLNGCGGTRGEAIINGPRK